MQRDGDLFGSAVNIAARLATQAEEGQVVVTSRVKEEVEETDPEIHFTPLGELTLRNVRDPVALFEARLP